MSNRYKNYDWAETDLWYHPVRLPNDDRRWYYIAKKMHKGVMHARLEGFDHQDKPIKKLFPLKDVTFIPRSEWPKINREKRH
jgi:hypothetical protein